MIAKNKKGSSFSGCVNYVLKEDATILKAEGVLALSKEDIIQSFKNQQSQRREIKQPVGHIPISFAPEDKPRMSDDFMIQLAEEYMKEMGIGNTQYIVVRHHDTDNDHLHIVYNRIDNDLKLISVNNDYKRNIATCKKLKDRHNLTYGKGKERVNRPKLNGADKVKYEIYDAMKLAIPKSHDMTELSNNLTPYGIKTYLKCRKNSEHIDGVLFVKGDYKFKGSEIDRKFSYNGLLKMFKALTCLEEQQQKEMLEKLKALQEKQSKEPYTPDIHGVKLTLEQWNRLKSGEALWIDNMRRKDGNGTFSAYVFTDDKNQRAFVSHTDPDAFVKYGAYEMRERDRRIIENGLVTKATVKWWGNSGQLAHPYLWKANPSDTEYQEAWSDPREQEPKQANLHQIAANSIADTVTNAISSIASAVGGSHDFSNTHEYEETLTEAERKRRALKKKKRGFKL